MKFLYLITNRLTQYYKKNRFVFLLFLLGGIINSCIFAYMYGNFRPIMARYSSTDYYYREYRVYFGASPTYRDGVLAGVSVHNPQTSYINEDDVKTLISTDLFETIVVGSFYPSYNSSQGERMLSISACMYGEMYSNFVSSGSRKLTADDQVIVDFLSSHQIGDTIKIRGNDYVVVGRHSDRYEYFISSDAYKTIDPYNNVLFVISKDRWHSGYSQNDLPKDTLESLFPNAVVWTPEMYERQDAIPSAAQTKNIAVVYLTVQIAFIFLLTFMSDSLAEENVTSLIVGGNPSMITALLLAEGLVISIVPIALGLVIHKLLYDSVFEVINTVGGIVYHASDYYIVLGIMATVCVITLIPYYIRYRRHTPNMVRGMME